MVLNSPNDKKLFFDGKSIRQEKDRIKKKNRAEGKGIKCVFFSIQKGGRLEKWLSSYKHGFPLFHKSSCCLLSILCAA
jgi:hypothetical protein